MLVGFLLLGRFALVILDLHACAQSQFLHGLFEIQAVAFHHELENVAAFITLTKTAPRARLGPDHKGRRVLVIVEGTKARVVLPRMAQFHPGLGNEVDNINADFDLINGGHGLV